MRAVWASKGYNKVRIDWFTDGWIVVYMLKGSLMERYGFMAIRTRNAKWNIYNRTHREHVESLSGQYPADRVTIAG